MSDNTAWGSDFPELMKWCEPYFLAAFYDLFRDLALEFVNYCANFNLDKMTTTFLSVKS